MPHPVAEPLRPFTQEEQKELQQVKRATSEPLLRHQQAVALLAVAEGQSRTQASRQAGWQGYETVSKLVRRFNEQGLTALDDHPRSGRPATYGAKERGRILQEARRTPDRDEDATATWSLSLLQRALRQAPDGLPEVSTFTILHTLHEAGYTQAGRVGPGVKQVSPCARIKREWSNKAKIPTHRKKNAD